MLASSTICRVTAGRSSFFSTRTILNIFIPRTKSFFGKDTMTAPSVPPNTMTAAVPCMIEPTWPPSSSCPSRMKPNPPTSPAMVVMSMRYSG